MRTVLHSIISGLLFALTSQGSAFGLLLLFTLIGVPITWWTIIIALLLGALSTVGLLWLIWWTQ